MNEFENLVREVIGYISSEEKLSFSIRDDGTMVGKVMYRGHSGSWLTGDLMFVLLPTQTWYCFYRGSMSMGFKTIQEAHDNAIMRHTEKINTPSMLILK